MQREDRRHSVTSSSPSSPVRFFPTSLDSPTDISQGLQGLHIYNGPPSSPFAIPNNTALDMIEEHQVYNNSTTPGLPYPEISVTDESGCLPVFLLQEHDSSRRPSITRGIGKPPPESDPPLATQ